MDVLGGLLINLVHPFKKTSARAKVLNIALILQNNSLTKYIIWSCHMLDLKLTVLSMKNSLKRFLLDNVKTRVTYTGQKLGTKFQIKDKTKDQHKHDLGYYSECPEPLCNEDYLGKTGRNY